MRFGHFDDKAKEYVIETPKTPLPWINYLGSKDFFTLISNTAGGYAFYKDARLRRLTRYRYNNNPLDQEGFRLYIRDESEKTPVIWNPSWQPVTVMIAKFNEQYAINNHVSRIMAGSVMLIVPVLIIYGFFQRWIIESMMFAAVKE